MDIQLKEKLIAKIDSINDEAVLQQLLRVLDAEAKIEEYYILSEEEEQVVKKGIFQLNNGHFLSDDESNKQANQCLNK